MELGGGGAQEVIERLGPAMQAAGPPSPSLYSFVLTGTLSRHSEILLQQPVREVVCEMKQCHGQQCTTFDCAGLGELDEQYIQMQLMEFLKD